MELPHPIAYLANKRRKVVITPGYVNQTLLSHKPGSIQNGRLPCARHSGAIPRGADGLRAG